VSLKLASQSAYLQERDWLQTCLIGDWHESAQASLPLRLK